MKRRLVCHTLAALTAIFLVGPLTFTILDRVTPVEIRYGRVAPDYAHPGSVVNFNWEATKWRDGCDGQYVRKITDAAGYTVETDKLPLMYDNMLKVGETKKFSIEFSLPATMHPGPATYQITRTFTCNFIQNYWPIQDTSKLIHFTVGPASPSVEGPVISQSFPLSEQVSPPISR